MTQIVVTLEQGADATFLRRMIENMKGVIEASIQNKAKKSKKTEESEWLKKLHTLKDSIDPSIIDMTDERTRYIMSK